MSQEHTCDPDEPLPAPLYDNYSVMGAATVQEYGPVGQDKYAKEGTDAGSG